MNFFKRILAVLVIAIMGVGLANAEFRFGVKAGLNVNNIDINKLKDTFDKDNGCGWTAGVMTEFQVPLIGLCFDLSLMYTRMNADATFDFGSTDEALSKNRNFIQVPLNIKYKISLPAVGRIIAPYIFTGPDFSFKLDKNTVDAVKTKTCQVAWNVGLGLQLVRHLQIGASYGFGINNIIEKMPESLGINTTDLSLKNNYWTITAAYLF